MARTRARCAGSHQPTAHGQPVLGELRAWDRALGGARGTGGLSCRQTSVPASLSGYILERKKKKSYHVMRLNYGAEPRGGA